MQKKNIFKTVALAMLMPAMLLTTACSSEVDVANINNEPTVKKGYALPVTVNVTRQGDATTRATYTYNENTKKGTLAFSDGDKMFVSGNDNSANGAGQFAGTLTWQSGGTFSGTIYTQEEWTGTADALFTPASAGENLTATLLPNGYDEGSNSFLSINNNSTTDIAYDDRLTVSYSNAFVASETAKATGVEQLSLEQASTYDNGFALTPQCAILNFTISGLEASEKTVTLNVVKGTDYTVTGSVTPTSGFATFAIGVPVGANIKEMSNNLTVGSSNLTLPSSTTFAAGKIYNIARNAIPGALIGVFSVSDTEKVYFSKGNLQATTTDMGTSWTWAFAEHQYDYIGNASGNTKVTKSAPFISENATVDLFGWVGESSTWVGVNRFGITSAAGYDYLDNTDGYGNGSDENLKSDWGATMGSGWCTLTSAQWTYLFNSRRNVSTVGDTENGRYAKAKVNDVQGIILFPDTYTHPDGVTAPTGVNATDDTGWKGNNYSSADWTKMEKNGAVFLPAAGYRDEADVDEVGTEGYYWSSSANGNEDAYYVYFAESAEWADLPEVTYTSRYNGMSVRLVRPVQ